LINSAKNRPVIGIHPSGTPMDQIRNSITDTGMNYPTVVAAPGSSDIFGYPVKMYPYVIEVDEKGNVAKHGSLQAVLDRIPDASSAQPTPRQPGVRGVVLATEPDDGLAAISLGTQDGVKQDEILVIMRDGKPVGQLRVVLARKDRCVGKVVAGGDAKTLRKGDIAQR
jgi:hypothetical protein